MADGIESFDWSKNMARIAKGWKNGTYFNNPNVAPAMEVVDGNPKEVEEKLQFGKVETPTPTDSWNERRANAKI